MKYFRNAGDPFGEYTLIDSYERVEFQARGSPHEHIFLWLKDAPVYKENNTEACVEFIDRFISWQFEDKPNLDVYKHRHTDTYYKGKKNKSKCRFNFPQLVMPNTVILEPLEDCDSSETLIGNYKRIRELTKQLQKKQELIPFEHILEELKLTEEEYLMAIRGSLKKRQIFLKRSSLELNINCYNDDILNLFEANMDIQYVLDAYGCASYIINYVAKVDAGLTKLLKEAVNDVRNGNKSIKERLRIVGNIFINSNIMSAQEAAYHILSLPLSKSSRVSVFVNTSPINERVRMLKPDNFLNQLPEDSTKIYSESIHEKYSRRTKDLENVCLADFACVYKPKGKQSAESSNEDDDEFEQNYQLNISKKASILRYRRYNLIQDPNNYYREQMLLFLPWRNELTEIENVNHEERYKQYLQTIIDNRQKYSVINEDELDEALKQANNDIQEVENEEILDCENPNLSERQEIDIFEQGGRTKKDKLITRYSVPASISYEVVCEKMQMLNLKQRKMVMHVLNCFKIGKTPLHIFMSGAAGVGKSTVISLIYQTLQLYFNSVPGNQLDQLRVLLCAPSGKAAFLIEGVTLHTAFALPVQQFGGQMPELNADLANSIREKLFNTKLLIIDEVSMVGARLLSRVDTRLRQIMGIDRVFGDISVLIVGDLKQLPPVMDSYVFQSASTTNLTELVGSPLWDIFQFYELTEIMRQKDELAFIQALNNLSVGAMSEKDIKLIEGRIVKDEEVPESAIRLYAKNEFVDNYNKEKIRKFPGESYKAIAEDLILNKIDSKEKQKVLSLTKSKKLIETGGLPYKIDFKIGIKYMLTVNLDVEDGLVNGACGILKYITFSEADLKIIWLEFIEERVGTKRRSEFKNIAENEKNTKKLVPFERHTNPINISSHNCEIIRKQFPLVAAEALTIHKSQGQTYSEICVDLRKKQRMTRNLLYVAFSRVTNLKGLYILGKFNPPNPPKINDPVLSELENLKERQLIIFSDNLGASYKARILYQNVCSLRTNFKNIVCDAGYRNTDILILSETRTVAVHSFKIPGFTILFRTDKKRVARTSGGIICFLKETAEAVLDKHVQEQEIVKNKYIGQVDLLRINYNGLHIISGYKSPRVSNKLFGESLRKLLISDRCSNTVVMGDFNYDIYNGQCNYLTKIMHDHALSSALGSTSSTTNFNTQIDVIYTDVEGFTAGVYETYFSDHKPIYFSIEENLIGKTIVEEESNPKDEKAVMYSEKAFEFEKGRMIRSPKFEAKDKDIVERQLKDIPNENFMYKLHAEDKAQIIADNEELSDAVINRFGEVLSKFSEQENVINENRFQHQDTLFCVTPQYINAVQPGVPNIQILYGGSTKAQEIGHWICTYYNGSIIHIYDSLNHGKLTYASHELYLDKLYPFKPQVAFHKVQQQPNMTDCGLFAIAFAVTIYFKRDPENIQYDVKKMRRHLWQILETNTLTPFPERRRES